MLLVLQIAQYEAVALEVKTLLLVLFWTVFRIMQPGPHRTLQTGPAYSSGLAQSVYLIN